MAEPTKEELELMMRMILGDKYDPDFDPKKLGKAEDAYIGPSPDWNPEDTQVRMGDDIKYPFRLTSRPTDLSWAMHWEGKKRKRDENHQEWLQTTYPEKWNWTSPSGTIYKFPNKEERDYFLRRLAFQTDAFKNSKE